jgi:hypothetical protein
MGIARRPKQRAATEAVRPGASRDRGFSTFERDAPGSELADRRADVFEDEALISVLVLNSTLGRVDASKQGGPRTQSISIPAGLVGVATDSASGFDPTMISFQKTAA